MSEMILPSRTHVIPMTTIRRERILPVPGTATVRVNEKVQAADVIAQAEISPKHYYLDIARGLGIAESQAMRQIVVNVGEKVDEGDVIAGPVGVARKTVRAPEEGKITAISKSRVLLQARGRLIEMRAGFPGVVVGSDGTQVVTVETTGSLIQAVWGNGRQDFGVMRIVGEGPGARLQTSQLDIKLRGAVLISGICDHPAPLHQATELSVRGVILGGMSSDLIPVARRLNYPIILTEGFGPRPINIPAFNLLSNNVGREVALFGRMDGLQKGQRPEAVIPLPTSRAVGLPEEVVVLNPGVRVRVLHAPSLGEVGVVRSILPNIIQYPSGIRARSASIEVEGMGSVTVPLANIEILQ